LRPRKVTRSGVNILIWVATLETMRIADIIMVLELSCKHCACYVHDK
jgi:hypothetical protein